MSVSLNQRGLDYAVYKDVSYSLNNSYNFN